MSFEEFLPLLVQQRPGMSAKTKEKAVHWILLVQRVDTVVCYRAGKVCSKMYLCDGRSFEEDQCCSTGNTGLPSKIRHEPKEILPGQREIISTGLKTSSTGN